MHHCRTAAVRDAFEAYGLEKHASALMDMLQMGATTVGSGALMHMGVNAAYKAFSKLPMGKRFALNQATTGVRHGLAGKKLNPLLSTVANFGLGPEATLHYEAARAMGQQMQMARTQAPVAAGMALGQATPTNFKKYAPALSQAPVMSEIPHALANVGSTSRSFMDRIPTVPEGAKMNWKQKLSLGLAGAGASVAQPHLALHMGINGIRQGVANSALGKRFMAKQFKAGLAGKEIGKLEGGLTDYLLSPAALDPRKIGLAASKDYKALPPDLRGAIEQYAPSITSQMAPGAARGAA